MFELINDILTQFKEKIKGEKAWRWFVIIVIGFMDRQDQRGVTSIIGGLRLEPKVYHSMLHFFRSRAYKVVELYERWVEVALKYAMMIEIRGRLVLLGDHIKIAKEGRQMPCVQVQQQSSENSGKAEYIEGHCFGQISGVMSNGVESRAIGLRAEIQESAAKTGGADTLIAQMVKLGGEVTKSAKRRTIEVLDGYFCSGTTFYAADEVVDEQGNRMLEIVTRAKSNTVAYRDPVANDNAKAGRPRKYGEKVKLKDVFTDKTVNFESTQMEIYGKIKEVQYLCRDLFWKPANRKIRFVWAKTGAGSIVLMSSDRKLTSKEIITLYSLRFKIESGFDDQKNDMGTFAYHFWTDALPKRKKNNDTPVPLDDKSLQKFNDSKNAIHSWVCLNIIATGILSFIAFSHNSIIWNHFPGFIKTVSSRIPSVATTKLAFSHLFHALLPSLHALNSFAFIPDLQRLSVFLFANVS